MSKKAKFKREIDECYSKMTALLDEYNAEIYLDSELGISLADKDTKDSVFAIADSAGTDMYEAFESVIMMVNADVIRVRPSDKLAFLNALESWNHALNKADGKGE